MPGFRFGPRSEANLQGVHPDLVRVVRRALEISPVDFGVAEGVRDYARQKFLFDSGKSKTMNSLHLRGRDGLGHAVDLYPIVKAGPEFVRADFEPVVAAMKKAAAELGLPIECGHDWKSFPDSPHFQLPALAYPS